MREHPTSLRQVEAKAESLGARLIGLAGIVAHAEMVHEVSFCGLSRESPVGWRMGLGFTGGRSGVRLLLF